MKKLTTGLLLLMMTAAPVFGMGHPVLAAPQQNYNQENQDPFFLKKGGKGNQNPKPNWNNPPKPNGPGNQGNWQGNQNPKPNWNNPPKPNGPGNQGNWQGNKNPNPNWNNPPKPNSPGNQGNWQGNQNPKPNWNNPPKPNGPGNQGNWQGSQNPNPNWNNPPKPNGPGNQGNWQGNQNPKPNGGWQDNHGPNGNWNGHPKPNPPGNPGPWPGSPVPRPKPGPVFYEPDFHRDRSAVRMRADAGSVLHRTALILQEAQQAASRRYYSSGLAKAIAHQQKARDLYMRGSYQDAIFHSMRARDLAFQVLNGNHAVLSWNYYRDEMEESYCDEAPPDDDLDVRLDLRLLITDLAAVFLKLDIDIQL